MTTLVNNFEGGTSGTNISTGNSGGTSGNAFDGVQLPSVFSNAHAAHGTLSCEIIASATTGYPVWNTSMGSPATVWFREYLYFTANPAAQTDLIGFIDSGVAACARYSLTTAGNLIALDSASGTQITSTESVPLSAWFRIEGLVTFSATVGQMSLNIYNSMDSVTATETHLTAATVNTHGAQTDYRFGVVNTGTLTYWIDDLGMSSTGYLGPSVTAAVPPAYLDRPQQAVVTAATR